MIYPDWTSGGAGIYPRWLSFQIIVESVLYIRKSLASAIRRTMSLTSSIKTIVQIRSKI